MKCRDILQQIEKEYPLDKAYEWDNVGLLVGRDEKEVKKIYVALDATDAVIEDAKKWEADMLITHHPLIFAPLKKINNRNFIANRVIELLQADISYYAMHTNYDIVRMADLASERLGLEESKPLEVSSWSELEGLGKLGVIKKKLSVQEYAEKVKEVFGLNTIKIFGESTKMIHKVAILPGSGKSAIESAINQGADVLITGDIGHHEGIDAQSRGLVIFDAGHYGIEHIFIDDMSNYLEKTIKMILSNQYDVLSPEIQIKKAEIQHPFYLI